jgi:hypothetical protein
MLLGPSLCGSAETPCEAVIRQDEGNASRETLHRRLHQDGDLIVELFGTHDTTSPKVFRAKYLTAGASYTVKVYNASQDSTTFTLILGP